MPLHLHCLLRSENGGSPHSSPHIVRRGSAHAAIVNHNSSSPVATRRHNSPLSQRRSASQNRGEFDPLNRPVLLDSQIRSRSRGRYVGYIIYNYNIGKRFIFGGSTTNVIDFTLTLTLAIMDVTRKGYFHTNLTIISLHSSLLRQTSPLFASSHPTNCDRHSTQQPDRTSFFILMFP